MTATVSGLTVITEHVFSRKYELTAAPVSQGLTTGAKAGLAVGIAAVVLAIMGFTLVLVRKRRARNQEVPKLNSNMEERPFSPIFTPGPQELASPEGHLSSPGSGRGDWPMTSASPPAYNQTVARDSLRKQHPPQELPGSTFIYEHHPAFVGDSESRQAVTAPNSPPGSPPRRSPKSSVVSPLASPKAL